MQKPVYTKSTDWPFKRGNVRYMDMDSSVTYLCAKIGISCLNDDKKIVFFMQKPSYPVSFMCKDLHIRGVSYLTNHGTRRDVCLFVCL